MNLPTQQDALNEAGRIMSEARAVGAVLYVNENGLNLWQPRGASISRDLLMRIACMSAEIQYVLEGLRERK